MRRAASFRGIIAVLASTAAVTGCGERGLPAPDVVARISGQELPYADFENYLRENSLATEVALSSEVLSGLFDQYLDEKLLQRLAVERRGIGSEEFPRQAIEMMVEEALPSEFSDEEIAEFYARHREDFEREEQVVVRQILVETRETAEAAERAIEGGMRFEEAAKTYSQGPGAEFGGFQGELGRADLPPAFADVIFRLETGETSEIVVADYGFHLFQVVEKRPAATADQSQVRAVILDRLRHAARAQVLERLVEEARSSYNVRLYARNLPFNYAGPYG